jgi:5-bromo-4-chloroindolyl phosphate hydrolysis protein
LALNGLVQKEEMTEELIKIEEYRTNWNRIRHLTPEEIKDEPQEYQDAHKRFYDRVDSDMVRMMEIATKLEKLLEPSQPPKKTKGQRKRDKWAREQAYQAGEIAAAKKLRPNKS